MKDIYSSLKIQRNEYKKTLQEKKAQLQAINTEKQNIVIKKIHGELYYYAQYRKEGKIKSEYLGAVLPGTIAEIEKTQQTIDALRKEIKELEWNIQSLDKMIQCYEKRKKMSQYQGSQIIRENNYLRRRR